MGLSGQGDGFPQWLGRIGSVLTPGLEAAQKEHAYCEKVFAVSWRDGFSCVPFEAADRIA